MASWVVFAVLSLSSTVSSQSCPDQCVMCFTTTYICNTNNPVQDVTGLIIPEINVGAFQNGDFITSLDMSATLVSTIHTNSFQGLDSIQKLNLSHNSISSLPNGVFQLLDTLIVLDLSWNQIPSLPIEAFQGLTNLTHLYVHYNLVENMSPAELLTEMPSLEIITLSGNSWHCDCNISSLYSLLTSPPPGVQVQDGTSVSCSSPSEVANMPIEFLNFITDIDCPTTVALSPSPSPASLSSTMSSSLEVLTLSSLLFSSLVSYTSMPVFSSATSSSAPSSLSSSTFSTTSSIASASGTSITLMSLTLSPTPSAYFLSPSLSTPLFTSSPSPLSPLSSFSSSPLSSVAPSPSLLPAFCTAVLTESGAGQILWPVTAAEDTVSVACPFGPADSYASRQCVRSGEMLQVVWGLIDEDSCLSTSQLLQELADTESADNLEDISMQLTNLPFSTLSQDDLELFLDVATLLTAKGGNDSQVVENVLVAVDSALSSDSIQFLTSNPDKANELQQLISTALLEAVDANDTELVLQYENLLVASKYVASGSENVIVSVSGDDKVVDFDGNVTQADIIIQYNSDKVVSVVQITVYNNSDLFQENCPSAPPEKDCGKRVITPIAVVTTTDSDDGSQVEVTYEDVKVSSMFECAVWDTTSSEWISDGCTTHQNEDGSVTCDCFATGPIAIIEVPVNDTTTPSVNITEPSKLSPYLITFYILCGTSVLLHLPIIVASCAVCLRYDFVRNVQALVNHATAQALVFLMMALSWHQSMPEGVCLSLSTLLHYFTFCSFLWLMFRPVILAMSEVRRPLYERHCFIFPFVFMAWVTPMIPVVLYGVLTFIDLEPNITHCWLENLEFPNYFTYLSVCLVTIAMLIAIVCVTLLACSGYIISTSTFFQLASTLVELVLFSIAVGMQFVTGTDPTEYNLIVTGGLILVCGIYFFLVNGLARPRVRWTLFCRRDPALGQHKQFKQKLAMSTANSSLNSHSSQRPINRRAPSRCNQEMNLDYINDYFGYPLEMISQMGEGKRIKGRGNRPTSFHNQSDSSFV